MKLYYSPGVCSLSAHIALLEAGLPFTLEKTDIRTKVTAGGVDFRTINPKGYVPALELDNGSILTEGPAIVQYIADQVPQSSLAPAHGSMERYRLIEWLNYISTELHKGFSPLFNPTNTEPKKQEARDALAKKFDFVSTQLGDKPYLLGHSFTVADGYLFTVLSWTRHVAIDLSAWPVLQAFVQRVTQRPAVQTALRNEGLIKAEAQS